MKKIFFETQNFLLEILLNETSIAQKIYDSLPIESVINLWGEEIYFPIPVLVENERPTIDVEIGDIGYWPEGNSFCIFFGKTPISTTNKPVPYSEVTLVGKFDPKKEVVTNLKTLKSGEKIKLTK
jgi:hypothetical protein